MGFYFFLSYTLLGDIMLHNIYEYVRDGEFRFTIYNNKIHIVNYKKILSLESDRISFISDVNRVVIKGNNLVLNKLLEEEILIIGNIISVEVFND